MRPVTESSGGHPQVARRARSPTTGLRSKRQVGSSVTVPDVFTDGNGIAVVGSGVFSHDGDQLYIILHYFVSTEPQKRDITTRKIRLYTRVMMDIFFLYITIMKRTCRNIRIQNSYVFPCVSERTRRTKRFDIFALMKITHAAASPVDNDLVHEIFLAAVTGVRRRRRTYRRTRVGGGGGARTTRGIY